MARGAAPPIGTIDQRQVVRTIAVVRVVIGVVALALPGRAARLVLGGGTTNAGVKLLVRSFGARDVALGVGTLRALDRDQDPAAWASASAACDGADALAALVAARGIPTSRSLLGAASATAVAISGYRASSRLG